MDKYLSEISAYVEKQISEYKNKISKMTNKQVLEEYKEICEVIHNLPYETPAYIYGFRINEKKALENEISYRNLII